MAPALAKTPKPTLAQIEAAKKVEAEKKKAADAQAAKLAAANQNLRTLTAKANAATALYVKAQKELAIAEAAARAAAKYAAETATAVEEAHRVIGWRLEKPKMKVFTQGGGASERSDVALRTWSECLHLERAAPTCLRGKAHCFYQCRP